MFEVWSGGQTGVDQAALRAARRAGLVTGGWAAKGWETLDGTAPWLSEYGLKECPVAGYPPRTEANIRDTDFTVLMGDPFSFGSKLAIRLCDEIGKNIYLFSGKHAGKEVITTSARLYVNYPAPELIAHSLNHSDLKRVNFAGNRETSPPTIGPAVERTLFEVFTIMKALKPFGA